MPIEAATIGIVSRLAGRIRFLRLTIFLAIHHNSVHRRLMQVSDHVCSIAETSSTPSQEHPGEWM
jgi:hypothetical protein